MIYEYNATNYIEQGTIGTNDGNSSSTTTIRSSNYIQIPIELYSCKSITVHVESEYNVQIDLLGFDSNTKTTSLFDLYWYNNDYVFDMTSYTSAKYIRLCIRKKDESTFSPSDISSCVISFEGESNGWVVVDGKLTNAFFGAIQEKAVEYPFAISLWNTENGKLTNGLHGKAAKSPIIDPFPKSLWSTDKVYGLRNGYINPDYLEIKARWIVVDGKLTNPLFNPDMPEKALVSPFPNSIWRTENNKLTNLLLGTPAEHDIPPEPEPPEPPEPPTPGVKLNDYANYINKPMINGVELSPTSYSDVKGNKTHTDISINDLGIYEAETDIVKELIIETFGVLL